MEKRRRYVRSGSTIRESYIPDLITWSWFRFCCCKKSLSGEWSISPKEKTKTHSHSARVKSGKAVKGRPTLCHVLSRSAWHFISVSPPSLPLRLRKVCGKQHLQFSFQMPMHVLLLSTQSHRDVEWIKNNTPTHTLFFFSCVIYIHIYAKNFPTAKVVDRQLTDEFSGKAKREKKKAIYKNVGQS